MMGHLLQAETHFAFGENWQSFVKLVDHQRIAAAEADMQRLLRREELAGKSFLDIGSGSGLSSLAAARLGAASIMAVDIDANSIAATRMLLEERLSGGAVPWSAKVMSVFESTEDQYDVVYSWGVLHHTGDMWRAIREAAMRVKPGGFFAIAIYAKTSMCGFWRIEKAFYSRAPSYVQACIRAIYNVWYFTITALATRRNPFTLAKQYNSRGMDRGHDIHDWLGGYPYESATPEEIQSFISKLGFAHVRQNLASGKRHGLLASGCDEYLFKRM
ncbi:class I SAM-dependent methyltransferase [Methylobacterium planeticum]|uniref:Class I SAM-dependent methyltransferase n=1 Tax=Methylobacterium planeticum TaxID=2615211 RepID=A0A6N6MIA5_9HYPH|nr:class I SAM-dependent methyltransferase [Methylobacterium planeticum]KAB1070768.1 class I SAM-dependent methyltransferase [Methylobacterium planeticum]